MWLSADGSSAGSDVNWSVCDVTSLLAWMGLRAAAVGLSDLIGSGTKYTQVQYPRCENTCQA